jgi:hypothetical protein
MSDVSAPVRRHRVLVGALLSLAVVIGIFAMVAVWVNRQALNTDAWTKTSGRLLEDKKIQAAVSAFMVDELFTNVDVAGQIRQALPPQAAAVAGPVAAGLQQLAGQVAPKLLAAPRVQEAWRTANRTAHKELLSVINGGNTAISTDNGEVVLNLRSLVDRLAATLGVSDQVAAARSKLQGPAGATARSTVQQKLGVTLPPTAGRVVLMRSEDLKLAQDVGSAVRHLAVVLTALTLILFALAVWLAQGWRRVAFRSTGWCFIGLGVFVLLVRRVAGNAVVDGLVTSDSVKPAAHSAWTIGTTLLYDIGIAMFAYGVVFVVAAWVAGSTRPALALRRELAPALRFHLASVYGAAALLYLLLVAWGPTAAFRKPLGVILFAALVVLGIELLRRQVAREHPDVERGESGARMRERLAGASSKLSGRSKPAAAAPDPAAERLKDLEALAALHDRGVLSDEEFNSEKVLILNGS